MNSILRITDPIPSDNSFDRYEEIVYEPVAGTNLNASGQDIRLTIETQDIFTHPSESFLIIEGRLLKADNNSYGNNDLITLTNNGIMHLFKRIRYDLSGQEIESLVHPGQATTMLGLLKYPDDFSKSKGSNQLWYKDTTENADDDNVGYLYRRYYIIRNSDPKESFSFRISQFDSASIPQNSTSFSWRLSVKSSPEVPRFIIVGFQTSKSGSQVVNPSLFDNVNVSNFYAMLNSMRYPTTDYNISFLGQKFSRAYGDAAEFRSINMDELISNPNINPTGYRNLYPLFLFDFSKQSEKLKYSTTDIQSKMHFSAGVPLNTQAYAVIISDRLINFQSDGNKFSVVY